MTLQSNHQRSQQTSGTPSKSPGTDRPASEPLENSFYQRSMQCAERAMSQNPKASLLVPLACGIGVGLLIGFVSSGLAKRRDRDEWFSRRTLDRLAERLPEALGKHLHS